MKEEDEGKKAATMPGDDSVKPYLTDRPINPFDRRQMKLHANRQGYENWLECLEIGGESVYIYLQNKHVMVDGVFLALATLLLQLFSFWIFFLEAYRCGITGSESCTSSGFIERDEMGDITIRDDIASPFGISAGLIIAICFLGVDFVKGIVFLMKGYYVIALVHCMISVVAIVTTILYAATTAVSDVSVLTAVVVLVFITELDERAFELHMYVRGFSGCFPKNN